VRPERGSAEARSLLAELPLTTDALLARRRAAYAAVSSAEEEGDEPLDNFRPRVLSRPAFELGSDSFFATASWSELGLGDELRGALAAAGAERPSHIQAAAWRLLCGTRPAASSPHCLLMDAAGSGKTLAYLAPLLHALRRAEAGGGQRAAPHLPHAVVLVPTSELAAQVLSVVRALSLGGARVRTAAFTGGRAERTQVEFLAAGVELLVGTPGRLAQLVASGALRLDALRFMVLDEADVLAGPHGGFGDAVLPLLDARPPGARVVLVTATLPAETREVLAAQLLGRGGRWGEAVGPGLHRPAGGLQETLVDCSGGLHGGVAPTERAGFRRKAEALVRLLQAAPATLLPGAPSAPATLVFCNTLQSCRDVENALKRRDRGGRRWDVRALHAAVSPEQRDAALAALRSGAAAAPSARLVVVSTDRASRGLDCAAVGHVVLFDFPRDPSEYVRRAGRTARGAGGSGRLTSLVLGRQVALARDIMARNAASQPLMPV
jgi:ATP-dependent RNA helicase DDX18/HAS1